MCSIFTSVHVIQSLSAERVSQIQPENWLNIMKKIKKSISLFPHFFLQIQILGAGTANKKGNYNKISNSYLIKE